MYKFAIEYGRFSSTNQRDESIDAQFRAIREYAEKNNITIAGSYSDEAISGKSTDREEFQQMIADIMHGRIKVDVILVHKFNRFARNKFDSAIYKKKLKEVGVKVVSVTQSIEDTPEGAMMESFLEAMDEYYSANLALEVQKGLRENALKGKRTGGPVLYGYDLDENGDYVVNEEEAAVVKRIFEDYAAGVPRSRICANLNAEGFRTKRNGLFVSRTIGGLLRNEKYIGNYVYTLSQSEVIRVDGIIPVIIDIDLWQKAQAMHGERIKKRPNRNNTYHLTGKAFCGHCGCTISGDGGGKKLKNGDQLWYYSCVGRYSQQNGCPSNKINKNWIERTVIRKILDIAFDDETIRKISELSFSEINHTADNSEAKLKKLKKELSGIIEKQKRITLLYLDGNIDIEILNEESSKMSARKQEIEMNISRINSSITASNLTAEDIFQYIKAYSENIKKAIIEIDDGVKQSLINTFVERVVVSLDTVKIQLRLDFQSIHIIGCDKQRYAGAIVHLSPLKKQIILSRSLIRKIDLKSIITNISKNQKAEH